MLNRNEPKVKRKDHRILGLQDYCHEMLWFISRCDAAVVLGQFNVNMRNTRS